MFLTSPTSTALWWAGGGAVEAGEVKNTIRPPTGAKPKWYLMTPYTTTVLFVVGAGVWAWGWEFAFLFVCDCLVCV